MPKPQSGDMFAPIQMTNIHGVPLVIPDTNRQWVHLHFARFAACPICNVHLQNLITGARKLSTANIREVVLFTSPNTSLLPYQGNFPFNVVGDPDKVFYQQFEVGSSLRSLLDPRAWPTIVRAALRTDKPQGPNEDSVWRLPADILIAPDGRVKAVHYAAFVSDVWSVDQIVTLTKS
jgi:peroxiredoxin